MIKDKEMISKKTKKTNISAKLLLTIIVPVILQADTITIESNGTFIEEEFTCKVALADYAELQRVLKITPKKEMVQDGK